MGLMLLAAMLFRFAWVQLLEPVMPSQPGHPVLAVKGMLMDLKFISVATLVLWLLGQVPGLHFFKTHAGKHTGRWLMTFFILVLLVCLALDFGALYGYGKHLNTKILGGWLSADKQPDDKPGMPLLPLLIAISLATWLSYMFFGWLHKIFQKGHVRSKGGSRFFMQTAFVMACVILLFANTLFGLTGNGNKAADFLVTNVWQSFFSAPEKMAP